MSCCTRCCHTVGKSPPPSGRRSRGRSPWLHRRRPTDLRWERRRFSLLALAAESQPLLILLDDDQWIDQASAEALAFAARRLDRERNRDHRGHPQPRIPPLPSFPSLTLEPMSPADCRRLLQLRSGVAPAPAVTDRILAESGGIPLAIVAAADLLSPAQLGGHEPLPIPLPVAADMVGRLLDETDPMSATARGLLVSVAAADTRSIRVISMFPARTGSRRWPTPSGEVCW